MEYFTREHYLQTFLSDLFVEPACVHRSSNDLFQSSGKSRTRLLVDPELVKRFRV